MAESHTHQAISRDRFDLSHISRVSYEGVAVALARSHRAQGVAFSAERWDMGRDYIGGMGVVPSHVLVRRSGAITPLIASRARAISGARV